MMEPRDRPGLAPRSYYDARIEEGADVAIFDGAAEKVATLGDDAGIEDRAESRGQDCADGLRQSHLVRREDPSPGTRRV